MKKLAAHESSKEHHKRRSDDETLVEMLAFAVVEKNPKGDDEKESRHACERELVWGREGGGEQAPYRRDSRKKAMSSALSRGRLLLMFGIMMMGLEMTSYRL